MMPNFLTLSITHTLLLLLSSSLLLTHLPLSLASSVTLDTSSSSQLVLSNGNVTLTILTPSGRVTSVTYGDSGNLLMEWPEDYDPPAPPTVSASTDRPTYGLSGGKLTDRGYWDATWEAANGSSFYTGLTCEGFETIKNSDDIVTVKFYHTTGESGPGDFPINVDIYFSLARDDSSFYSWSVVTHLPSHAALKLVELRFVMKLSQRFTWSSLGKDRQRVMPKWEDRSVERSEATAIGETRKLINPMNPEFANEYETKYNYLVDIGDQLVYGWASDEAEPLGIWFMNPYKYEYTPGGPTKQELTIQVGPYLLNYMHSQHVGTPGVSLADGESWTKTYGPFKVYLNKHVDATSQSQWKSLFNDARATSVQEYWQWPYSKFSDSSYYPKSGERGNLKGYLAFPESAKIDVANIDFKNQGWVGLGPVGNGGSWAYEVKNYQYWSHFGNSKSSNFRIHDVRPGNYTLHIFIIGVFGDYASSTPYYIEAGKTLDIGPIVWAPPRSGPTLFELGYPDRDSAEFYVPDINPLSPYPYPQSNVNRLRDYGVWKVYAQEYPKGGPVYIVGVSDWTKDWWFIQPAKYNTDGSVETTVQTIQFELESTPSDEDVYMLRLALSGKHNAALQVYVNTQAFDLSPTLDTNFYPVPYSVNDNGMARSTSHGAYYTYNVKIKGSSLNLGTNKLYFRQRKTSSDYIYVAYDYIRLEGPPASE